jgi:hypothetical protein
VASCAAPGASSSVTCSVMRSAGCMTTLMARYQLNAIRPGARQARRAVSESFGSLRRR